MHPEPELRRGGVGGALFAAIVIGSITYLTFAALQGEHGLFRLIRIEAQESRMLAELAGLKAERADLTNKTQRLSNHGLDLEMLDEQAREVLGLGHPAEMIIR